MSPPMSTFILATGGYDPAIYFYDATTQNLLRSLPFPDQHVIRLAFSGKGPAAADEPLYIVVGGAPTICVYDITNLETASNIYLPYQGHTEAITAVGFEQEHNAFVYSASEDGTLQVWLPGFTMQAMQGHGGYAGYPMGVMPENRRYMNNRPGSLGNFRLFDEPFMNSKFRNRGAGGMVAIHDAVYYPPKDLFFTADAEGRIRAWDRRGSGTDPVLEVIPHYSRRNLQCLELSSDYSMLITANFDGLVFVYDVKAMLKNSSIVPVFFRANSSYITRLRISVTGNLLACTTKSKSTKVFRMSDVMGCNQGVDTSEYSLEETVSPTWDFAEHPGWVWDVSFVGELEDYLFTCSSNMRVMLWDLNDVRRSTLYKCHKKPVVCLAVKERWKPGVNVEQFALDPEVDSSILPPQGEFFVFHGFRQLEGNDDADGPPYGNGGVHHSGGTQHNGGTHNNANGVRARAETG